MIELAVCEICRMSEEECLCEYCKDCDEQVFPLSTLAGPTCPYCGAVLGDAAEEDDNYFEAVRNFDQDSDVQAINHQLL